jgi:copper homeostasis protein
LSKVEIACFNLESALIAQQGGADRIELCDNFAEGGTTPAAGTVETARELITTALFVMIRPRGGNFVYTEEEFGLMKKDLLHFKKMKVNGFVFGILESSGKIDLKRNKVLVALAGGLPCTFHRAFDQAENSLQSLEDAIHCGFKTILCSGHAKTAEEGMETLKQLLHHAGDRISIMPGGGVRSSNIEKLRKALNTEYYHSSAITRNDVADLAEVKLLRSLLNP